MRLILKCINSVCPYRRGGFTIFGHYTGFGRRTRWVGPSEKILKHYTSVRRQPSVRWSSYNRWPTVRWHRTTAPSRFCRRLLLLCHDGSAKSITAFQQSGDPSIGDTKSPGSNGPSGQALPFPVKRFAPQELPSPVGRILIFKNKNNRSWTRNAICFIQECLQNNYIRIRIFFSHKINKICKYIMFLTVEYSSLFKMWQNTQNYATIIFY